MQVTGQSIVKIKNSTNMNTQAIAKLENQMGQLASQMAEREKGKFPSQPIANPKGQFVVSDNSECSKDQGQVQSIITLRLGRQVNNQVKTLEE